MPASSFQMMRAGPASGFVKATSRRTWLGGTVNVESRKLKLRRAAAKLPHGATRVHPIAGARISNVVSKFRSGAELLSFSVTAGRREIVRKSPSNLTNGQETGKIFQRKMFHALTVFFCLVRRFLLDPASLRVASEKQNPKPKKRVFYYTIEHIRLKTNKCLKLPTVPNVVDMLPGQVLMS